MFTGITLPFTVTEMLSTAWDFITIFGPFILLGLALILSPLLIKFMYGVVKWAQRSRPGS